MIHTARALEVGDRHPGDLSVQVDRRPGQGMFLPSSSRFAQTQAQLRVHTRMWMRNVQLWLQLGRSLMLFSATSSNMLLRSFPFLASPSCLVSVRFVPSLSTSCSIMVFICEKAYLCVCVWMFVIAASDCSQDVLLLNESSLFVYSHEEITRNMNAKRVIVINLYSKGYLENNHKYLP